MDFEFTAWGAAAAFAAGVASFLSPCVLPLVPGYVSFIAGTAASQPAHRPTKWPAVLLALLFVLGFSAVFITLGATASAAGQFLLQYRRQATVAGGVLVMVFGLLMLGMLKKLSWFQRDVRWHLRLEGGRPIAAFGLGLAFGFGWTPCIGPVLGAILTVTVASSQADGVGLLALYSAGLGVPFVLAGAFTSRMLEHQHVLRRLSRPLQFAGGIVLLAMGAAMVSGHLSDLSYWLLRELPWLGRIG